MPVIQRIDNVALNFIYDNMRFPILDRIMPAVSSLGNKGMCWILISTLLILSGEYRAVGLVLVCTLAVCALVGNFVLKPLFARIRPCGVHREVALLIPRPTDFSFPSGHTATSFAAATILFMTNVRFGMLGLALAILIAFSRAYLFVHYLSDIIAGMIIGVGIAFVSMRAAAVFEIF